MQYIIREKVSDKKNEKLSESHNFMIYIYIGVTIKKKTVVLICPNNCLELLVILARIIKALYLSFLCLCIWIFIVPYVTRVILRVQNVIIYGNKSQ